MRMHGLIAASTAAFLIAASCATAPAAERKVLRQPSAPPASERSQQVFGPRASETTGSVSAASGALETAKSNSEARRVTGSVGRTLERMEEMFRTPDP
jgi:hypothetical protein